MAMDLTPVFPTELSRNDAGVLEVYSNDYEILKVADVGARRFTLNEHGLLLPRYTDSPQLYYVLEGTGKTGLVFPESPAESVKDVKKGDAVAVPEGTVNWWYNTGSTPLKVLSLGDTTRAHKRGEFTDFYLAGAGVFKGFTTDFLAQAWGVEESIVKYMVDNQVSDRMVKLDEGVVLPKATGNENSPYGEFVFNCEEAPRDVDVKDGGRVSVISSDNMPILKHLGFGGDLVKLDPHAMCSPGFSSDTAFQVTYIVRGSGRVQVVSNEGKRVIDVNLKAGNFFIVPRFYIVSKRAGSEGMEWFSIITTEKPVFSHLAGRTGVMKSLSPEILRAAFKVDDSVEKSLRAARTQDAIFFPPYKSAE